MEWLQPVHEPGVNKVEKLPIAGLGSTGGNLRNGIGR